MKLFNDTPKDILLLIVTGVAITYPFVFAYNFKDMGVISILFSAVGLIVTARWDTLPAVKELLPADRCIVSGTTFHNV